MALSSVGDIVQRCWLNLPRHFSWLELDAFVIMPNHLHGIIVIGRGEASSPDNASPLRRSAEVPAQPNGTQPGSLGAILQNFKSVSTRKVNKGNRNSGLPLWQRNYYEHVIRNEEELKEIREYIINNPANRDRDEDNIG